MSTHSPWTKTRRGRKSKGVGERFAAMAWFSAVLNESSAKNVGELSRALFPPGKPGHASNIAYKYRAGLATPEKNIRRICKGGLTAWRWLQYPLWSYLDEREYSIGEVSRVPINFPRDVVQQIVGDYYEEGNAFIASRTQDDWFERFDYLRQLASLDAFTGVVVLLRQLQAGHLGDTDINRYGCFVLLDMWRTVYGHEVLGRFATNLYRWLTHLFCHSYVVTDSLGKNGIPVRAMEATRETAARQEISGWSPEKATIHAKWLELAIDPSRKWKRQSGDIQLGDDWDIPFDE
ncbi:MAG: hypothetical protein L6Q52_12780 [Rhodocyclaceae bacterium]|nr:hypothetical protein [Rhodocyclaceae bacterium]